MRSGRLILIIYLVIGVLVAATRGYLAIKGIADLVSLAVAVLLWPLLVVGINIGIGGGGGGRRFLVPVGALVTFAVGSMPRRSGRRGRRLAARGHRLTNRHHHGEGASPALVALHPNMAPESGDHVLDQGEAQADAAGGPRVRGIDLVEALEDPLQPLLGDPHAVIAHDQP